jgi:hypothetical protein
MEASMKRQPKSGSRSKRKRVVAKRTAKSGATITEYSDGSRKLSLSQEASELLKAQFEAFKAKFGREPGPHDPVFFDPDSDTPKRMDMDKMWNDTITAAVRVGIRPATVFAMWVTQRVVTSDNEGLLSPEEREEWDDAAQEYIDQESERSRIFRVLTIEGANAKSVADADRLMELARSIGVYDAVLKQIDKLTYN